MTEVASAILVGRTNVGKSSLFNRLVGRARAIVSPEPGTTRDINRALVHWRGGTFWLEDSGGFSPRPADEAGAQVQQQLERALRRARVILLVVDGTVGLTPEDRGFIRTLRHLAAHPIMVVNKVDGAASEATATAIRSSLRDTVLTSAHTGRGLGDLLDLVTRRLPATPAPQPLLRLGLFGKTNVGKSSLFNRLLKQERSIVLPSPHTTRDRLHDFVEHGGTTLEIIDTAGLRRQARRASRIEQQAAQQSARALTEIEVALLVIDGARELTWQDQRVGDLVAAARTAAVVVANKADLVPAEAQPGRERVFRRWLPMLAWAPVVWASALAGTGCQHLIPQAREAAQAWQRWLTARELERAWKFLSRASTLKNLPLASFVQEAAAPPCFVLYLRRKADMPKAVGPWVEGQLRQRFGFSGTPLQVRLEGVRGTSRVS